MDVIEKYNQGLKNSADEKLVLYMDDIISQALPKAEKRISYGLVGYYQPKAVCFFGINKNHIGFYPMDKPIAQFQMDIKPYLHGKTTLHFKKDVQEIPVELVQNIAKWNLNN